MYESSESGVELTHCYLQKPLTQLQLTTLVVIVENIHVMSNFSLCHSVFNNHAFNHIAFPRFCQDNFKPSSADSLYVVRITVFVI